MLITNVLIYDIGGNCLPLGQSKGENMRMKKEEKRDIIKDEEYVALFNEAVTLLRKLTPAQFKKILEEIQ